MGVVIFRTLKKQKRVIVAQNLNYNERYLSGQNKGKVKKRRQIQYCKDLDTIFVDEQLKITDKPKQTPIYIENGDLKVDEDNITLLDFMRKSPQNKANGGKLFKELDIEKEQLFELEKFDIIDDAKEKIRKAEKTVLKGMAISLYGYSYKHKTDSQIQIMLRTRVDSDVEFAKKVNAYLDNQSNKERQVVTLAMVNDVITVIDGKKIAWKDGEVIYIGSQAKDVIQEFSVWVKTTDEGRENLKLISDKLDQIL